MPRSSSQAGNAATGRILSADNDLAFKVVWEGGPAALDHLVYNGVLVVETPEYAPGAVTVKFSRPREGAHVFEWTLLFPGRKLQNLAAKARVDQGAESALLSRDSAETRWQGTGSL